MMPTLQETHFNSPEQVEGYLRIALELVEKIGPAEDLREVAFAKAVDLVSAKNVMIPQVAAVPDLSGLRH
jgi:hypothetical protein